MMHQPHAPEDLGGRHKAARSQILDEVFVLGVFHSSGCEACEPMSLAESKTDSQFLPPSAFRSE